MTLRKQTTRAETWDGDRNDPYAELRYAAAAKLNTFRHHRAGGGSQYITIGGSLEIRFADHEKLALGRQLPTLNIVGRKLTTEDVRFIEARITYPEMCKKTAFAKHVGLTVPKRKRLLSPDCFEDVCENEAYPNTLTEYVVVANALAVLEAAGMMERVPACQESYSHEDYDGRG